MPNAKLLRKSNGATQKLLKNLKDLENENVQVGHFSEQGQHSSGDSLVDIITKWHFGTVEGHENVRRSPLTAFSTKEREFQSSSSVRRAMKDWAKSSDKNSSVEELLDDVGKILRFQYTEVFGVVGPHMPPDSDGTPMFETGELKNRVGYKTSKNNKVKEG